MTETAAMPEVSLPLPAYAGDLTVNCEQEISDLMDAITWFHSHVLYFTAHQNGHAQALYVRSTLLPRLENYKQNVSPSQNGHRAPTKWGSQDSDFLLWTDIYSR